MLDTISSYVWGTQGSVFGCFFAINMTHLTIIGKQLFSDMHHQLLKTYLTNKIIHELFRLNKWDKKHVYKSAWISRVTPPWGQVLRFLQGPHQVSGQTYEPQQVQGVCVKISQQTYNICWIS